MVSKEEFKRSLELRFESVKKHNLSINEAVKMCMLDFEDKDFFTKQEIKLWVQVILNALFLQKTKINFKGRFQCSNLDIIETYWCNSCGYDFLLQENLHQLKEKLMI